MKRCQELGFDLLEVKDRFPKIRAMNKFLCLLAITFYYLSAHSPVMAACTDPPEAEVNWQRCNMDGLNFDEVQLTDARLRDASFLRGSLNQADLQGVSGFRSKFVSASLIGSNFSKASLSEADFTKANLESADLSGADLRRARLYKTILRGANLTKALLKGADLTKADLSGATWTDGRKICAEGSIGRCK